MADNATFCTLGGRCDLGEMSQIGGEGWWPGRKNASYGAFLQMETGRLMVSATRASSSAICKVPERSVSEEEGNTLFAILTHPSLNRGNEVWCSVVS